VEKWHEKTWQQISANESINYNSHLWCQTLQLSTLNHNPNPHMALIYETKSSYGFFLNWTRDYSCRRGLLSKISKAIIFLEIHVSIQDNMEFSAHLAMYSLPNNYDLRDGLLTFMKTQMRLLTLNLAPSQFYKYA